MGSVGGVLLDAAGGSYQFFAATLGPEAMDALSSKAANPIAAVELLACLIALALWADEVRHRAVIGFVDNEAAKCALVKGGSAAQDVAAICGDVCAAEIALAAVLYWERVPSSSNIADAPSRGARPVALPGLTSPRQRTLELTSAGVRGHEVGAAHLFMRGLRNVRVRPESP